MQEAEIRRIVVQNNQSKKGWRHGSSGRAFAQQAQSPLSPKKKIFF
jgi:hypothetical protein